MTISTKLKACVTSHPVANVLFFTFIALLPVMTMRDFTPANELRYLSIADEAIAEGHVFAFYNQGEAYADKPPLYFWLIMLCRLIFGKHSIFALSMMSLIPSFVTAVVADRWLMLNCRRKESAWEPSPVDRTALCMMVLTTGLYLGMSVFLRMDMLMCMFIMLALFCFWKMYEGIGSYKVNSWIMPLFIFLALFTKGPVGLLVPPVAILVFLIWKKDIRSTGKYLGWKTWGIIAGLSGIWILAAYVEGGSGYIRNLLFHQTVDRAVNAFHHKEPFWYYAAVIWYVAAPYSFITIPSVVGMCIKKRGMQGCGNLGKLAVCTIACTFVMLSCFSSKLAIYLAPILPFLAIACPLSYESCGRPGWMRKLWYIPTVALAAAGAVALICLCTGFVSKLTDLQFIRSIPVWIAAGILFTGSSAAVASIRLSGSWNIPAIVTGATLLLAVFAASFVLPQANDYIGYGNLCAKVLEVDPESDPDIYTLHVKRPENMDVYLGKDITDYGCDSDAFLEDCHNAGLGGILIITSERVDGNLELYLSTKEHIADKGPYSIWRF
ncbi:MAG: ArnT family glycosyltransferase [Candidatus Cryptobacteroides sp.]